MVLSALETAYVGLWVFISYYVLTPMLADLDVSMPSLSALALIGGPFFFWAFIGPGHGMSGMGWAAGCTLTGGLVLLTLHALEAMSTGTGFAHWLFLALLIFCQSGAFCIAPTTSCASSSETVDPRPSYRFAHKSTAGAALYPRGSGMGPGRPVPPVLPWQAPGRVRVVKGTASGRPRSAIDAAVPAAPLRLPTLCPPLERPVLNELSPHQRERAAPGIGRPDADCWQRPRSRQWIAGTGAMRRGVALAAPGHVLIEDQWVENSATMEGAGSINGHLNDRVRARSASPARAPARHAAKPWPENAVPIGLPLMYYWASRSVVSKHNGCEERGSTLVYDTRPLANGLRTDHPVPGLPFVDDSTSRWTRAPTPSRPSAATRAKACGAVATPPTREAGLPSPPTRSPPPGLGGPPPPRTRAHGIAAAR